MFIEKYKNNGSTYLRLSENYRPEGSSHPKRRIVCVLGSLNKLSDGEPDFLDRLRESFRNGVPLIPELEPYVTGKPVQEEPKIVMLPFPVKGESQDGTFLPKRYADLLLNAYMNELGLSQLFRSLKSQRKIQYDLLGFVKLIVYGRILAPDSKKATVEQNDEYHTPIIKDKFNPSNVYDTLNLVSENSLSIFQTIDRALRKRSQGRDTSVIFYDVTNFFFEIEMNDPDICRMDGVVIVEGLRKRGHSKENRPQPIVQMGLFMDKEGVPIGIRPFPGNTVDKSTMITATSEIITPMGYERYIYCADRGLCTLANLAFLVNEGMGYLLSKSIKQSKKEERDWIITPEGYTLEEDENGIAFKYKHAIRERTYTAEDGTVQTFQEKVVVFWSREYYKRERHMMEDFSNFLTKLEEETKAFTLNASQIKRIQRFLKDEVLESIDPEKDDEETFHETQKDDDTSTREKKPARKRLTQEEKDKRAAEKKAEAARLKALKEARRKHLTEQLKDSETARTLIDWEKVNRWRDYAGYYQIVTSELEMDDLSIINTYRELTQIENRFRTMKGSLCTSPIYLSDPVHIEGHLVLCTVALTLIALIQGKIKTSGMAETLPDQKWYLGMTPERIQEALNALTVESMPMNYIRFRDRSHDTTGKDLQKILASHGISLEARLYTPGELRSLRGSVQVLN